MAIGKFIPQVCTHVGKSFVSLKRIVAIRLMIGHMMQQIQMEIA